MPAAVLKIEETPRAEPVFQHEKTALFQGDVCNSALLPAQCLDLIITSPPYNVGIDYASNDDDGEYSRYLQFCEDWMTNCFWWTKETGRFCLNIPLDKNKGGQQSVGADLTAIAKKIGWKYQSTIIWNEGNISRRTAWGSWQSASAPYVIAPVELIVIFYKGAWKRQPKGLAPFQKKILWRGPTAFGPLTARAKSASGTPRRSLENCRGAAFSFFLMKMTWFATLFRAAAPR